MSNTVLSVISKRKPSRSEPPEFTNKLFSTAQVYSVTCAFHGGQCCAGWAPGIISLFLGFGVTFWTSRIIASFHEYGGKRNIRYRDLASSVLGEQRIYVTVKKPLHH